MIPRYEIPEIAQIWADKHKFEKYVEVELAVLNSLEKRGIIPQNTYKTIKEKCIINPSRIDEIEQITRHDVIAFCTSITENLDPKVSKYFHFGVTSSDIIDTALTLQLKDSIAFYKPLLNNLIISLQKLAIEHKNTLCMGRSHGMNAEPMSFGQKWLGFALELARRYKDLCEFENNELTCQISGAVGNYTILSTDIEADVACELGLKVEEVSTQVIPRDRIAKLININSLIADAIERTALEIRHLHHSDIAELHEGFAKGQKGSSTMPHKKNPISGENLSGLARVLRSHLIVAHENTLLWHERDISHSSAERMILPDNFGLISYALKRMTNTINNLVIHKEFIEKKVENNFTYLSSFYLHQLILQSDLTREKLYELTQQAAFKGHEQNSRDVFYDTLIQLMSDCGIKINLPRPDFSEIKNIYLKNIDDVFKRSDNFIRNL